VGDGKRAQYAAQKFQSRIHAPVRFSKKSIFRICMALGDALNDYDILSIGSREDGEMRDAFRKFAQTLADAMASAAAFLSAIVIVLVWLTTGPMFRYSDTWQLVINTGTSVITFLMVFLIRTVRAGTLAPSSLSSMSSSGQLRVPGTNWSALRACRTLNSISCETNLPN
jgi:hypothetical protein